VVWACARRAAHVLPLRPSRGGCVERRDRQYRLLGQGQPAGVRAGRGKPHPYSCRDGRQFRQYRSLARGELLGQGGGGACPSRAAHMRMATISATPVVRPSPLRDRCRGAACPARRTPATGGAARAVTRRPRVRPDELSARLCVGDTDWGDCVLRCGGAHGRATAGGACAAPAAGARHLARYPRPSFRLGARREEYIPGY